MWMIVTMLLYAAGFDWISIGVHLMIVSGLLLLAISDMRTRVIPDTVSIPLIGVVIVAFVFFAYFPQKMLLPFPEIGVLGAFIGMVFYMVQMMIPAGLDLVRRKMYADLGTIILAPFLFSAWMMTKICIGEKRADKRFPSLSIFDTLPSWVGGGDIRLGFIIGLLTGPYDFLYVIMYGYIAGTVFFLLRWLILSKKMQTMPVAPLLFLGLMIVW